MRIAYCTNVRLPSERAHGHQIAKVVKALTDESHDVELFVPYRRNTIQASFESYYGLTSPVHVHHLGSLDGIAAWWAPGVLGLKLMTYLFTRSLRRVLASRRTQFDVLYTRTPEILPSLTGLSVPVIVELHKIPRTGRNAFLRQLRKCRLIVALTGPMRTELIHMGVSDVPVIVEGDAVDLHDFESLPDPSDPRASLKVPKGVPLLVYTGQLKSMGLSKGIGELLGALEILHERGLDFRAVIAGGPDTEKAAFEKQLSPELRPFVSLTGHLPYLMIPTLMTAADVLIYPAPASNHPYYKRDTSPLKIFEYMASGRPIVSADLPPIHDIADETMLTFVPPGDSEALADGIRLILDEPENAEKKARLARLHVEQSTWEKRMKRILEAARLGE
jgi:glycosyltransferase involved in cell wall biosynthesis